MAKVCGSSETAGVGLCSVPGGDFKLLPRWERAQHPDTLLDRSTATECELSDQLQWLDQTSFRPIGRRDEAVQVGGINVFPRTISERLQGLPEVAAAVVRLMSTYEGERLKAFIVPAEGYEAGQQLETRLHVWCTQNLPAVERPKAFALGLALPQNHLGKQSDW